jgi:ATPase subunit of ABC transporter with duplicated ATPase domains
MFSAPDAGIPASVLADAPAIHMAQPLHLPAPERTVLPPVVQNLPAATNVLLLDDGRVSLNGRQFILPAEVYEHVLEEVISAYEGDLAAEVAFYRSRMQPSSRARKKKMRKASRKSAVVRRVPKQAARAKSAKPRPKAAPDVQPLPESTETK